MSDSNESVIPSTMNLRDVLELVTANLDQSEDTGTQINLEDDINLTDAKASTSVSAEESYELGINYNQNLSQKIASLANTGMLTDVDFLIGKEKTKISAHKLILALSTPVFKSMFYSPMLESQNVIEIPDCQPEAFQIFLEYLYKENVRPFQDVTFAMSVLYVARKYAVKVLEDICAVTLSSSITPENVFDILHAANLHSMSILESECWAYIEDNTEAVLTCHLENIDLDMFSLILSNDRLNIKEVKLFEIVTRWIDNELSINSPTTQDKLKVRNIVLSHIRFPTMTGEQFADSVVPTGLMTVDQIAKILTYINTSPTNKHKYAMDYSIKVREPRIKVDPNLNFSLSPLMISYEIERDVNHVNVEVEEERPRSRRSRRSRRNRPRS